MIDNTTIIPQYSIKYLGIIINDEHKYILHINDMLKKSNTDRN